MTGAGGKITTAAVLLCLFGVYIAGSTTPIIREPPRAASPRAVARTYLLAAVTGDCSLTAALTAPHSTWSWCDDPKLLAYNSVAKAGFVPASQAGRSEECVPFQMYTHGSSDGSMPVGWQPWSLCFISTSSGWRVYDQGQG